MITTTNFCFGETEPSEYMIVGGGIMHNTDIRSEIAEGRTVWYATSAFIPEGDALYATYKQAIEVRRDLAEIDVITMCSVEGTPLDTTTKARLYARLVHDGKKDFPKEIPDDLIQATYDAYTNYYKFQPPLTPPNEE